MIKQRGDKMWTAHCDKPGCPEVTDSFLTYTDIMLDLMNKKWSFCDSKSPCFCQTCSENIKKNPVCIAREKEYVSLHDFNYDTTSCPHAAVPTYCPAKKEALWKTEIGNGCHLKVRIHRSPEFLAACSRCLGESQYSVVDAEFKKEIDEEELEETFKQIWDYIDTMSKSVLKAHEELIHKIDMDTFAALEKRVRELEENQGGKYESI